MKKMQRLTSPVVILAATTVLMVPVTSQAFEAKLSGQVSRMIVLPDDAAGDEIQFVDIGWSGSRFRFTGSEMAENGIKYGFRFEIQARENSSGAANGGTLGDTGDNQDNRYQDLYFSGDFGKVSFGKGDGAANGSTEVDYSGTALSSAGAAIGDNYGNYQIAPGITFKSVFVINDALSRQNRVRYDTPDFNGFSLAGSLNQGNSSEIAARYKGDFGGNKFGAALFFATAADVGAKDEVVGVIVTDANGDPTTLTKASAAEAARDGNDISGLSASLLLTNGLNFTVAYSQNEHSTDSSKDREATFFKAGYKTGMHAVTIDFGQGEGDGAGATEGDTVGLTYAVFPHKGVEMFATVRTLDSDGVANSQSVDILAFGSRIKF